MARLRIEGKMNKEAMRCLKKHLSNVVFRQLLADLKAVDAAARRVPARSLRQVARRFFARASPPEETGAHYSHRRTIRAEDSYLAVHGAEPVQTGASSSPTVPLVKIAAGIAVILLAVIIVFQMALALGAPLGKAAWGGQHEGVLPKRLRIASGVAALVVYPLIVVAILGAAGFVDGDFLPGNGGPQLMWAFGGLFTLGGIANLVSRSTIERYWAPVSIAIAICCAVIASAL
jgi:hypothetical protein